MKKAYTKPKMYAETFQLVEHIAHCSVPDNDLSRATQANETYCSFNIGYNAGDALFGSGTQSCTLAGLLAAEGLPTSLAGAEALGIQCYNSFYDTTAGYTMFGS